MLDRVNRAGAPGNRRSVFAWVALSLLSLAACQGSSVDFGLPDMTPQTPASVSTAPVKTPTANGEIIGSGPVRVALLLPKSAPGNGATIANDYRNAAMLALADLGGPAIEIVVKDTGGDGAKAYAAAAEAVREGSSAILGPVFSPAVKASAPVAQSANIAQIAFTSDPAAARRGTWLIGFLPDTVIDRSVAEAISRGKRTFAAILPEGEYGTLVENQLRQSLANRGGQLLGAARYQYEDASVTAAVQSVLAAAQSADAILIPDGGNSPVVITRLLVDAGVDLATKLLIGSGQWRSSDLRAPNLRNGIFADMDQTAFAAFKARYRARFGADPSTGAGLAYDAVLLVAGLARSGSPDGLSATAIESPAGFRGVTGIFRFRSDGRNDRPLAIYRIQDGAAVLDQAAAVSF